MANSKTWMLGTLVLLLALTSVAAAEPPGASSPFEAFIARDSPPTVNRAFLEDPVVKSWILRGTALSAIAVVVWAILGRVRRSSLRARRRTRINQRRVEGGGDTVRVRELEVRERELLKFFVNFPEQVKALNSSLDLHEVAEVVGSACHAMLGAARVQVYLLDESREELRLLHARDPHEELVGFRDARISAQLSPQRWMLRQVLPTEAREIESKFPRPGALIEVQGRPFPFEIASAIYLRGEVQGLIAVDGTQSPSEHSRKILSCLANVAAISLDNARHMQRALHLADIDRMTELYNHAYFQQQLVLEVDKARHAGADVSIFLLDVDNFKMYNDREGHPAGDALLKRLARILNSNVRVSDVVARYGGEEFVVLMPGTGEEKAFELAERLRVLVAGHPFLGSEAQPTGSVTLSGGVVSLSRGPGTAADLVKSADIALYRAKQLGRNQVRCFEAEFESERRRGERRHRVEATKSETRRTELTPVAPARPRAPVRPPPAALGDTISTEMWSERAIEPATDDVQVGV